MIDTEMLKAIMATVIGGLVLAYLSVFLAHPYIEGTGIVLRVSCERIGEKIFPAIIIENCLNKQILIKRVMWTKCPYFFLNEINITGHGNDEGMSASGYGNCGHVVHLRMGTLNFYVAAGKKLSVPKNSKEMQDFNSSSPRVPPGGKLVIIVEGKDSFSSNSSAESQLDAMKFLAGFRKFRVFYNNGMSCCFDTRDFQKILYFMEIYIREIKNKTK